MTEHNTVGVPGWSPNLGGNGPGGTSGPIAEGGDPNPDETLAPDRTDTEDVTTVDGEDPSNEIRFRVELSRADTANNPTLDSIARRWKL